MFNNKIDNNEIYKITNEILKYISNNYALFIIITFNKIIKKV